MAGFENDIVFAKNGDFSQADNQAPAEANGLITNGQLWIGRSATNAGGTHIDVNTLTQGTGISIVNGPGTITISNTGSITDLHGPKFIVGDTSNGANYSTIAAALTAASSGDTVYIQATATPYSENLTLKAGVNIAALGSDSSLTSSSNVIILGKATFTAAGTVNIYGVQLKTNSDNFLSMSGSNASIVNLNNCYLNCSTTTGISNSVSNSSSQLNIYYCQMDTGTTGIAYFSDSSTGALTIEYSECLNTGASTTANTKSNGQLVMKYSSFRLPITYSSSNTSSSQVHQCLINTASINSTFLTTSGTGAVGVQQTDINTGSASSISIGSGTSVTINQSKINSSNTNVITGAGTVTYSVLAFTGTGNAINVTTQNISVASCFQKVIVQTITSTSTYTPTTGMKYVVIECQGGGAGGGGVGAQGGGFGGAAGGGGAGGFARGVFTAATVGTSQSVTINTGGAGGTSGNNPGSTGGSVSVGALISANGGSGGAAGGGVAVATYSTNASGGTGTGGSYQVTGANGGAGLILATGLAPAGGMGANSFFGSGGKPGYGAAGNAASGFGAGGGGASNGTGGGNLAGGAGTNGMIVFTEYV